MHFPNANQPISTSLIQGEKLGELSSYANQSIHVYNCILCYVFFFVFVIVGENFLTDFSPTNQLVNIRSIYTKLVFGCDALFDYSIPILSEYNSRNRTIYSQFSSDKENKREKNQDPISCFLSILLSLCFNQTPNTSLY